MWTSLREICNTNEIATTSSTPGTWFGCNALASNAFRLFGESPSNNADTIKRYLQYLSFVVLCEINEKDLTIIISMEIKITCVHKATS